jgi:DNA repair exonuclease SbcCD ATPase subunit
LCRHTTSGDRIASDQHGSGSNFLQLAESPRFQEKESPFQAQVPPRQSTPSPAQPSSPPKISEEELSKYFSEADFPSTVSLSTQEDLDMVAAVLQKEIPTKTEDVDTLRTMLFRLGSANGVPSSQQEIFNKIALQLSDISRDYLGFQDQYAHAARSLNKIETMQSSKSVLKKAYSELEEERKATLQIQKEMEERMIFLKAEQKRIKKEIMELTPEASQLAEKLKSANSQRVKLYTDSTGIDSELKPLLDQKLGLQMDFQNSQTGLKLKRQTWEHFRVSLEEARVPPSIYTFSRTVSSSCSQARGSSYD